MAYITVNETGTFPILILSTQLGNGAVGNTWPDANGNLSADSGSGELLNVTCLQDITITNNTGIFSWTDFCSASVNKVTTPSDNEISTNIVIEPTVFFGNSSANTASADYAGLSGLSQGRTEVAFRVQMNGGTVQANTPSGIYWYAGKGYISGVAPTVSPDSPVWVSPLTIAVSGDMDSGG
jgi:hypothetical protein